MIKAITFTIAIGIFAIATSHTLNAQSETAKPGTEAETKEAELLRALAQPESKGSASLTLAKMYTRRGDLENAFKHGQVAVELLPESSEAHTLFARSISAKMSGDPMFAMANLSRFWESIDKAIKLDPKNIEAWRQKVGFQLYAPPVAGGSMDAAKQTVVEAQAVDEILGLELATMVQGRENNLEDQLASYRKLAKLRPEKRYYRTGIGMSLMQMERFEEASRYFETLYTEDPGFLEGLYRAGQAKAEGEFALEKAIEQLSLYLAENKEINTRRSSMAHYYLGRTNQLLGRLDRARQAYAEALALQPDNKKADEASKALNE